MGNLLIEKKLGKDGLLSNKMALILLRPSDTLPLPAGRLLQRRTLDDTFPNEQSQAVRIPLTWIYSKISGLTVPRWRGLGVDTIDPDSSSIVSRMPVMSVLNRPNKCLQVYTLPAAQTLAYKPTRCFFHCRTSCKNPLD